MIEFWRLVITILNEQYINLNGTTKKNRKVNWWWAWMRYGNESGQLGEFGANGIRCRRVNEATIFHMSSTRTHLVSHATPNGTQMSFHHPIWIQPPTGEQRKWQQGFPTIPFSESLNILNKRMKNQMPTLKTKQKKNESKLKNVELKKKKQIRTTHDHRVPAIRKQFGIHSN